jgi:hypothetical protein
MFRVKDSPCRTGAADCFGNTLDGSITQAAGAVGKLDPGEKKADYGFF